MIGPHCSISDIEPSDSQATMDHHGIPLFINPTAGRGRAGREAALMSEILNSHGIAHTPVASRHPGDMEDLVFAAVTEGQRKLLIAGGDGSVHEAVNGILRTNEKVEFGVIPVGTGNDFAKACSIPLHWTDAVTLLAQRMKSGAHSRQIDAGRFNDRFFANGAGIGFDAKVSRISSSIKLPIGDFVYLLGVFRAMWDGIATPELSLAFGDTRFDGKLTLAGICNGPWVGGMFHLAPNAANDDGVLDLVYAEAVSRWRILGLIPKIIRGTHLAEPEVTRSPITKCKIVASAPVPSHLDGEIQEMQTEFNIEILAGALHLL